MPQTRRTHQKVRTGCFSCKKRRIKCDECKPICKNCAQHQIECEYPETRFLEGLATPWGTTTTTRSATRNPTDSTVNGERASSAPAQGQSQAAISPSEENVINLRLLHHYMTSTCQTLSPKRDIESIWRVQVPELAFAHHYLLHMIFAISALHLCRKSPSNAHYMPFAYQHYEASLRASSQALSHISSADSDALYAVSVFAFVFEFATASNGAGIIYNQNGSLADWIAHSRGVRTVIGSSWHQLTSGPLKELFICEFTSTIPAEFESCLEELVGHVQSHPSSPGTAEVYEQTIEELVKWSRLKGRGFYGWLCQYPDEYGELLARRDPFALVILGYSCILLQHGEPQYWTDGWAERLIKEVYNMLNTSVRAWLQWPMEELGVIGH